MLRLVEEGKLSLDSAVNVYLKSWKVPVNKFTAKKAVTLRRIASHSAGLTIHGFPGYKVGDSLPTVPQILGGKKPANTGPVRVDVEPGKIMRYAGGGTTGMQLVLTDMTGETFPALMKRLVIDPIGMTSSTYEQPLPASRGAEAAAAHEADGTMTPGRAHTYPEMAAAGLWTTPTDLLKWALEIAAARAGTSTKILSKAMATAMLTVEKAPVGLGPFLGGAGRAFHFGHGGSNQGFRSEVIYFPETGQGAAVMANGEQGSALAQEILYSIAARYRWPEYGPKSVVLIPVDSTALDRYVGTYYVTSPFPVSLLISREGTKLFAEAKGGLPREQFGLVAPDKAIGLQSGIEATFVAGRGDRVEEIELDGITLKRKDK
jgi:CubicO group peptidase (beta-lactamase class C family)